MPFGSLSELDSLQSPPVSVPLTRKQIDELTYKDGIRQIKKLGLKTRDLRTIEAIRDFLRDLYYPPSDTNETEDLINNIASQSAKLRAQEDELAVICDLIEPGFSNECKKESDITDLLKDMEAGLDKTWKEKIQSLKNKLCKHTTPILIAGETGSGKSSLINLLIKQRLLPVAEHPCTATICVIKNSTDSYVRLRYDKENEKNVTLERSSDEIWNDFISDRSAVESEENRNSFFCRRAEFHTPLPPPFREGMYFVDSPGFREGRCLTQVLHKYMPKAAAFILVLRTDNCGGLNDPVKEFILRIRSTLNNIKLENEFNFANVNSITDENVIFVFNHWDKVIEEQTPERSQQIRQSCVEILGELWPGVEEGKNVFFLSIARTFAKVSQDVPPDSDFVKLQKAVFSLIPKSHQSRIAVAHMWMQQLARNMSSQACRSINLAKKNVQERTIHEQRLQQALTKAKDAERPLKKELKEKIDARQKKFLISLLEHLRSQEALARMCDFGNEENVYSAQIDQEISPLPSGDDVGKLWGGLPGVFLQRVFLESKFWSEEKAWQVDKNTGKKCLDTKATRFALFLENLCALVIEKFGQIDKEAQCLEKLLRELECEGAVTPDGEKASKSKQFQMVEKALFGITAIIWVPLAVVGTIVSLPIMAGVFTKMKIEGNIKLKKYRDDKVRTASSLLKNYVNKTLNEECLKCVTNQFIKVDDLKTQIEKYFPTAISKLGEQIESLTVSQDNQEKEQITRKLILTHARKVLSHLSHFAALNLHLIPFREEHFDDLQTDPVIRGDFFDTVHAKCRSVEPSEVAVKIVREPISSTNAFTIFREEQAWRILCKLQHQNIVRLYGLVGFGDPMRVGFVMERNQETLRQLVLRTPAVVPFMQTEPAAKEASFNSMAAMVLQVTRALAYIHQHNYIHCNLKMDTVMVFRNGRSIILKLCDFGQCRSPWETTSVCITGTHLYLSPEILNQFGSSTASDVYALGLMMWEMYHAETVFSWLPHSERYINELKELHNTNQMELVFKDPDMPSGCRTLIHDCARSQAPMRPPISQVFDCIKKLVQNEDDTVFLPDFLEATESDV